MSLFTHGLLRSLKLVVECIIYMNNAKLYIINISSMGKALQSHEVSKA